MALEPAGISLQAEGFNKYIKQLDAIDKAQQDIFAVDSSKTVKAFGSATKAADKYEKSLKDIDKAQKQTVQSSKQFAQGVQGAAISLVGFATGATVQFAAESAKLSAQFQGQQIGLKNLAAAAGQSGSEIQSAIQRASKGTVSGLNAITAANQGLLFGVAKTPEQFAELTKISTTLGRTLGLDATRSIEEFTLALGRGSKEILDNFGVSAKAVTAEIERLAQADFGVANAQLTEAQKQATFLKAALNIAGEAAAIIGDEAGNAQAAFDRLEASSENLKVTFGALVQPLGSGIANALSRAAKTAQQFFAFLGAGFAGLATTIKGIFGEVAGQVTGLIARSKALFAGDIGLKEFLTEPVAELRSFGDILDESSEAAINRFKEIASTIEGVSFEDSGAQELAQDLGDVGDSAEEAAQDLSAYENALKQAQDLQLSFARAAEDSAIKLARANEDIARKQAKQVEDLEQSQVKDRDKLLQDQTKQLDRFEKNRRKQIASAEADIQKARKEAGEKQKRDQQKLQRELQQAQDRFNLSRLQSERRFDLQEARLRAEGDILGLKELREDFALSQQEEKENFDLSKKEQISAAKESEKEQAKDLETKLDELKTNLEDQRAQLLASFDEQLANQQVAQAEARAQQQLAFQEAAAEREIALQREEEDRRRSQARQLEDLGRSLAEQQGVTESGSLAIAGELEKVFGVDGVADSIMTGFTDRTESDFKGLFDNIEQIASEAEIPEPPPTPIPLALGGGGGRIGGLAEFADGGVVPGPIGSPQPIIAHAGETVLPTHQKSFTMTAPIIPSQSLDVNMAGGFDIRGGEGASAGAVEAAVAEMTDNFRIAVQRLARRN